MPPLPVPLRLAGRDPTTAAVTAFESATSEVLAEISPRRTQLTLKIVAGFILLIFGLMAVVKLDRVVSGIGRTVAVNGLILVQPLDKSIIRTIDVSLGQLVHKGQVLATLDPTFAAADLVALEQKVASLTAETTRLTAEVHDQAYEPTDDTPDTQIQASIYRQNQTELKASIADFDARISSLEATAARLEEDIQHNRSRLKLAGEIEGIRSELERREVGSKLNTLVAADQRVEIERLLTTSQNSLTETQHDRISLIAQRVVLIEKWHADRLADLSEKTNTLREARQELIKAQRLSELVHLEAAEDAVVLSIGKYSVGSVMQQAEPLFTMVPLDAPLEADVEIDTKDAGFLHEGDHVEIKLDAYRYIEHGTIKGEIKSISQDSFTEHYDNQPRTPYYRARVRLTDTTLRSVPADTHLIPGMTLIADVIVGRRTILSYLLEGVLRTGHEAMREP